MTQQFVAADVLAELVARDGQVVTMPNFSRPTATDYRNDPDMAVERASAVEDAEISWMAINQIRVHQFCSVDRSLVQIHVVGTSETATCANGHRWLRTFGERDGYRQVQ